MAAWPMKPKTNGFQIMKNKLVCNMPFAVNQSGGRPVDYCGSPDDVIRYIQKFTPGVEIIAVGEWSAKKNKTTIIQKP